MLQIHVRARESPYVVERTVTRGYVPDEKVPWSIPFADYKPTVFEHEKLATRSYADPCIMGEQAASASLKFHQIDGKVDRTSVHGDYQLDSQGLPLNPMGRTGIRGRGGLAYWGPNHAADPIVTRWKRDAETGQVVVDPQSGKRILQFAAIKRRNTGEWAIPGGMVDAGEEITSTLRREFGEEALDTTTLSEEDKKATLDKIAQLFTNGVKVYAGYVDDPRNTDNAWMETVAVNYHDEPGTGLGKIELKAGDDAVAVRWTDIDSSLKLYASHTNMIELVAKNLDAHWNLHSIT